MSDVDPPYWKTFYARPLPRVSLGDVTGKRPRVQADAPDLVSAVNSKSDNWNDNLQSFKWGKNEASVPVSYADWTSVPVP